MDARPVKLLSPAKLNLFLHVTGRRADGYHELQTLFQLLDYGDDMEFSVVAGPDIELDCPAVEVSTADNLVTRAARLLQEHSACSDGAHIRVNKRIPAGGGLGGGSSNAATTLLALDRLWGLNLGLDTLARLGLQLGADVPVFVRGNSAWAEGIGEQLQPVDIPLQWYLVIAPACEISTAEVFSKQELTRNTPPIKIAAFLQGDGRNDCESVVRSLYPEVDKALIWLEKFSQPRLTGTGACVFAAFESEQAARAVHAQLPDEWRGFVARGVNRSPVHRSLD